jgi:hypothetical protein
LVIPLATVRRFGGISARRHVRRLLVAIAVVATLPGAVAAPASAFYQRYLGAALFAPGSTAFSAWNRLTFNATSFTGGSYYLGTKYARTDGTSTTYIWSNAGSIFDSRTIAYGRALCTAKNTNPGTMYIEFCDTGNT